MITALINDDTIAVKTARPSAINTKLKPNGNVLATEIVWPWMTAGTSRKERTSDTRTKIKALAFLKREETLPKIGRINAPKTGIKIIAKSIF